MATSASSVKYVKAVCYKNKSHKTTEMQVIKRAWVFKSTNKVYLVGQNIRKDPSLELSDRR